MSDVSRAGGPIPIGNNDSQSDDKSVTTVQVGENKLSDVAGRLGVHPQDLQKANPQFSDTTVLKAGQEIKLLQNQGPQDPTAETDGDDDGVSDQNSPSSSSPLGDPLVKGFIQSKLEEAGKQTEFSAKDLGQFSGGASAGGFSKAEYKPLGSNYKENASYQKILSDQSLGQLSGGASAGKFKYDLQKIHLEEEARYHKGGGEFIKGNIPEFPRKDIAGTQDGGAFGKESLSHVHGHDLSFTQAVDKSTPIFGEKPVDKQSPLKFEKVAGGEPLEQVSLNYQKVQWTYTEQKKDGTSAADSGPSPKGYDIPKLKAE